MPKPLVVRIAPHNEENTTQIQAALDQARNQKIRVIFEPGQHICGGLRLWSDTSLHLCEGAELHFISSYDAYAETEVDVVAENSDRAMMTARDAQGISITGKGHIVCDGTKYSLGEDKKMGTFIPMEKRPRVLVLDNCSNLKIDDITIKSSPMWTLHFVGCRDIKITGIHIDNNRQMPNTDGIVVDGCQDVSITECDIRTADDGVVLKTSTRASGGVAGECCNIRVANSTIESESCALKIGTESFAAFKGIVFEDCKIIASNRGLGIFSRDGGTVDDVRFSRIDLECHESPGGFWGSGEAVTINVLDRRPEVKRAGKVTNVIVENITGRMEGAINLYAQSSGDISNVTISDINISQTPGPLGTALAYDLRPTPADLESSPDAAGRINAWRLAPDGRIVGTVDYPGGMPGVYVKSVADLTFENVTINRPDPLPAVSNANVIVQD